MWRAGHLVLILLASGATQPSQTPFDPDKDFRKAGELRATDMAESMRYLSRAAEGGHLEAQAILGLAHAQGLGGVAQDLALSKKWLRAAAKAGHAEATFNLVAICQALPSCLEAEDAEQALAWLRQAAAQNFAPAAYEAAHLLLKGSHNDEALTFFLQGARVGHAGCMYNAATLLYQEDSSSPAHLTRAVVWFGRAAAQSDDTKVTIDAAVASKRLRRLWVQRAEASDLTAAAATFEAAYAELDADTTTTGNQSQEAELLNVWSKGARHWDTFELAFERHASYDNAAAHAALRAAMEALESGLPYVAGPGGAAELLRYLLLSKLAEGAKALAREDGAISSVVGWVEQLVDQPLCAELFAEIETHPSCFNDQLAAAITMRRRLNETDKAEELRRVGIGHPKAATQWRTPAQTPRVFLPHLEATPWWEARRFEVSAKLEAAWTFGELQADLRRIDAAVSRAARSEEGSAFARIVSSGAPIRAAPGADGDAAGVWSEFMLFNGTDWMEERCAAAFHLCSVLRNAPEVSGEVVEADGTITRPQGQVTVFRLKPGARVLPHVGVTNRRLVLQFPLRGWDGVSFRVDDEWRHYAEGKAMVFDDSFEHEVVHRGLESRFVLYAVLHHPGLGTPRFTGEAAVSVDPMGSLEDME